MKPSIEEIEFHGIAALRLNGPRGASAVVSKLGAQVLSWVTPDGRERLFLSDKAVFDGSVAIRGGIPVCVHMGLTPQSVNVFGGYKVQGRDDVAAQQLLDDARALAAAGVGLLVLELVPAALARTVSEALSIPVIGIGAGVDCDGQVLVVYDMLGIYPGKKPRFVKNFLEEAGNIPAAIQAYVAAVKAKTYPSLEHGY